jgi:hypothetical protein
VTNYVDCYGDRSIEYIEDDYSQFPGYMRYRVSVLICAGHTILVVI